jgi:hypothetical protein
MEQEAFGALLTALITAQSIIVAVIVIWKQYWIHVYQIYTDENRRRWYKYNETWHVSYASSNLSWAAITAILSVVLFIITIMLGAEGQYSLVQRFSFGFGLGLSIFSMIIVIAAMLFTAITTGKKACRNEEWRAMRIYELKGILKAITEILIGRNEIEKYRSSEGNIKYIESIVNKLGEWVFVTFCISIKLGLIVIIFIP